jgi:putative sugar O-methyltransferase
LETELKTKGLEDFRRRGVESPLARLGATDTDLFERFINSKVNWKLIPFQQKLKLELKLKKLLKRNLQLEQFQKAKQYGVQRNAKPIEQIEASLIGNPPYFEINGKKYTSHFLSKYVEYAYCSKFVNFDSLNTIMELGAGGGKQVEVIKKFHPHICFYVFELAPVLYVCEKYLSSIFPNDVVSYRETREMTEIPPPQKGKIFFFGNWKLPQITNLKYDLFWNTSSLDQMEPSVVRNYLSFVNNQARYVYIEAGVKGARKAEKIGEEGVREVVTLKDYCDALSNFDLIDISKFLQVQKILPYTNSRFIFWERKI